MTIPRIPSGLIYALAGGILAGFLLRSCEPPHPASTAGVVQVDTADAALWRARARELEQAMADSVGRITSLRRALAGTHTLRPEQVTVYDTVIRPDTVLLVATIEGARTISRTLGLPAGDSIGGYHPAEVADQAYGNCDRRLTIAPDGRVQCVPARLGHLVAFVGAGVGSRDVWGSGLPPPISAHGEVGVSWSPAFRSTWSAELRLEEDGRAVAEVRRGVRLW